jgi:hydrogenase nickel incorporation protein HypA/HybF
MHEGAIAAAIIQSALEVREREHFGQVKTVTVLIGRLHHVVPEVLQNHFRILKKEYPPLAKSKLIIEITPISITCHTCDKETRIEQPTFVCSSCNSTDIEITGGREMHLKEIEGSKKK